jgi:hypothetical protein
MGEDDLAMQLGGRPGGSYIGPGPLWRSQNQIIVSDDVKVLRM